MSNYSQRMADLLVSDMQRWQARQDAENAPLADSRAMLESYHGERPLLKGLGMISPPQRYPNRQPRVRSVGVAAFSDNPEHIARLAACDVEPSVRVIHADGSEAIMPTSHFRRGRDTSKNRATSSEPSTVETARHNPQLRHNYND